MLLWQLSPSICQLNEAYTKLPDGFRIRHTAFRTFIRSPHLWQKTYDTREIEGLRPCMRSGRHEHTYITVLFFVDDTDWSSPCL
jgi:hypothetical protein